MKALFWAAVLNGITRMQLSSKAIIHAHLCWFSLKMSAAWYRDKRDRPCCFKYELKSSMRFCHSVLNQNQSSQVLNKQERVNVFPL